MQSDQSYPDLVFIMYDKSPLDKDALVRTLITNLNISVGPNTKVVAHQCPPLNVLSYWAAVGFAGPLIREHLNPHSHEIKSLEDERFEYNGVLGKNVLGYLFRVYLKA
jgi:hypothetical protein